MEGRGEQKGDRPNGSNPGQDSDKSPYDHADKAVEQVAQAEANGKTAYYP